jgi:sugar-specific transcriptional regulator TrmB
VSKVLKKEKIFHSKKMTISLFEIGLNKYEERVYLTLVEEGISSAKNISDITGIPYGKIYEVMNNLAMKGFLTVLPTKPMKFQAVSPREAILNAKKNIHKRIEKLELEMIRELEPIFAKTKKFSEPKSMFWMINGRANLNNKMEELIKRAKRNIYVLTSENGLKRLVMFMDLFKSASKKGVKINILTVLTPNNKEDINDLSFCRINWVDKARNHFLSIDGKECVVVEPIPDDENLVHGRDIGMWVLSSSFTKFLDDFFESKSLLNETNNTRIGNNHRKN